MGYMEHILEFEDFVLQGFKIEIEPSSSHVSCSIEAQTPIWSHVEQETHVQHEAIKKLMWV